jgi:hypothetical protein
MRRYRNCEFCSIKFVTSIHNTICDSCDNELEKEQTKEIELTALRHAEKFKCRTCNKGLPLTRRFHCEKCIPDGVRPTDNVIIKIHLPLRKNPCIA